MTRVSTRHERQIRLREVGSTGQARLAQAVLTVSGGKQGLQVEYLRRAGVGEVQSSERIPPVDFPHAALFRHAASREIAVCCWRALRQIRAVLDLESADPPSHPSRGAPAARNREVP